MATRKLEKTEMKAYFDRVSKVLGTRQVRIEVASLDIGDRIEAEWVGLTSIAYDPNDDALDIRGDHLDHRIANLAGVWVKEGADGLEAVEVERTDGAKEIVRLNEPLFLPSAV